MDRVKLFALLVAIASVHITAEGAKKKIRIHLPQKVKHIHHHKKVYITNHPASSQYAPAYLPSAEGAVAVQTNVALPAVSNIVPLNSMELYDESQSRVPGVAPAASKLLPMYRTRGYYGPKLSDWEDDYDLAPPPEPNDSYLPSAFSVPSSAAAASNYPPQRVKIIKVNDVPRKKVVRRVKPKRVIVRGRPQPEDEHPVSSFHEQFYSDLQGSGTLKKVRKPQRVEKIIDGDTEHIHTYSEEHIHKLVYDDGSKVDPVGSMTALTAGHSLLPIKSTQALLAYPSNSLSALGSMGTPSHLEFAGYNARDVTHDHIFHDHGEIPADVDITRNALGIPPKMSYNSQGLKIASGLKRPKQKYPQKYSRPTKATGDLSYYESIYTPLTRPRKIPRPTKATSLFDEAPEPIFRPLPAFNFNKANNKLRGIQNQYSKSKLSEFRSPQASVPAPFSVSNTVVHDYPQNNYAGAQSSPAGLSKFKEPFLNFEYEPYTAPSTLYHLDEDSESQSVPFQGKKGKKKSYSTQNISFGGRDLQTFVDHLIDPNGQSGTTNDNTPSALDNLSSFDDLKQSEPAEPTGPTAYSESTAYTIRETSPAHPYYAAMAAKALHGEQMSMPEASNDNYHYVEPPTPTTAPFIASTATTTEFYDTRSTDVEPTEPTEYISESIPTKRYRQSEKIENPEFKNVNQEHRQRYPVQPLKELKQNRHLVGRKLRHHDRFTSQLQSDPNLRGNLKYGDKI